MLDDTNDYQLEKSVNDLSFSTFLVKKCLFKTKNCRDEKRHKQAQGRGAYLCLFILWDNAVYASGYALKPQQFEGGIRQLKLADGKLPC